MHVVTTSPILWESFQLYASSCWATAFIHDVYTAGRLDTERAQHIVVLYASMMTVKMVEAGQ